MNQEILEINEDGKIRYQLLTPKYLYEACKVVQTTLFTTGNMCKATGVPNDPEALQELDLLPRTTAQDGITVIAIDTTKDKVVGVSFNKILQSTDTFYEDFKKSFKNIRALKILDFIITCERMSNLFELCNVDCLMEIFLLGTLSEYRKQGIAKKMCQLSLDLAQNLCNGLNIKKAVDGKELQGEPRPEAVSGIFTSFISQKIATELGFEVAAELDHATVTLLGEPLENPIHSETPATKLQYKILNKN